MSVTRRDALRVGLSAGAALAAGWRPLVAQGIGPETTGLLPRAADLITKSIPSSGQEIPVVGIGMRNYRVDVTDREALAPFKETLKVFAEGGGMLLDTSPNYGNSEEVCGLLLEELGIRDQVLLATKVDREERAEGVARMNQSFENLRTDHIELMQIHNLRGWEVQLTTLRAWKAQGRFRYIGITTSSDRQYPALEQIMRNEDLDFVQMDYSAGNRSAEEVLLPLAKDRGMAVLVNLPFGRESLFQAVGDRPIPAWGREAGCDTWAKVFLKYVVSHPSVTAAIPGTTKPHHAADNIGAAAGVLPDAAWRDQVDSFMKGL